MKSGRALVLAHGIGQRHRVIARGILMTERAMLLVGRIAGLRGIMRMLSMFNSVGGDDGITWIRTEHANLQPGDHAKKQQPCENVSHQRPGNSAQFGISARKILNPASSAASLAFHLDGDGPSY